MHAERKQRWFMIDLSFHSSLLDNHGPVHDSGSICSSGNFRFRSTLQKYLMEKNTNISNYKLLLPANCFKGNMQINEFMIDVNVSTFCSSIEKCTCQSHTYGLDHLRLRRLAVLTPIWTLKIQETGYLSKQVKCRKHKCGTGTGAITSPTSFTTHLHHAS